MGFLEGDLAKYKFISNPNLKLQLALFFFIIGIGTFIRIAIGIILFLWQLTSEFSLELFFYLNYFF